MIDSKKLLDAYDLSVTIARGIEGYHVGQPVEDAANELHNMLREMVLGQFIDAQSITLPNKPADDASVVGKIYERY